MVTKKLTYFTINNLLRLFVGSIQEGKAIFLGFENEAITSGVAIKLSRIKKEFIKELTTLEEELKKIEGEDEEAIKKRVDLWNTEIEVSFEPISLSKVEDLVPAKNDFGVTPNYSELLEIIAE